jgi:drug/metabolite transporter (DMT)-like permease
LLAFGLGDTSLFKSVTLIGGSKSYTIAYTFPLFTMFFAIIFLGESFLIKYLIGTIIIIFGIINAFYKKNINHDKENNLGLLAAFITAISWSIASILITIGIKNISVITANTIRFPLLFGFLFFLTRPWTKKKAFPKKNLYLIAISGILSMALGGIIFLHSVKIIGISRATSLTASSPVWAILLSKPLLKEKISIRILISALMVIVGTYLLV